MMYNDGVDGGCLPLRHYKAGRGRLRAERLTFVTMVFFKNRAAAETTFGKS